LPSFKPTLFFIEVTLCDTMMRSLVVLFLAVAPAAQAGEQRMNPIRKVVTMLQAMQAKVTEEGEREAALYKKYMCYCKNSGKTLGDGIAANEAKETSLSTDIKTAEADKASTQEALEQAQSDRAAAKEAISEATEIRKKEAAAYAAERATYDSNLFALLGRCSVSKPGGEWTKQECDQMGGKWVGAIPAIEAGMAGAFLQTQSAQVLRNLVNTKQDINDADRDEIMSFLSGTEGSEYAPQSGEIVGILKQIADEMGAGLAEANTKEDAAIKGYDELMAAKTKEVNALTASIERKLAKVGDLAMSIASMKNELTDTEESLIADKEFLANLGTDCDKKTEEWNVIVSTRADELTALAETIKVLNDDDALELFKKTLPSASASSSFMQFQQKESSLRSRALVALKSALNTRFPDRTRIDLIGLAIQGKKIGFDKVITMIDKMIVTLKAEQTDDDNKKEYCAAQLDQSDDKKKSLEKSLSDTEAAMATAKDGIAALADEIAALNAGIHALDKSVAEATQQRKDEHKEFQELMASSAAAKELLGFAKNRLNRFYNPKLYKAPPKVELSKEDRVYENNGGSIPTTAAGGIAGTGITVLADVSAHDAPPPPPEAPGAYKKKSGETSGVVAMINLLITDLDKEMAASEAAEKDAQGDYEQLMSDSAAKRSSDSALLTEKSASKASLEGDLQSHKDNHASLSKDFGATLKYIASLHAECDWLLKFFDMRQEARSSEIDALGKAKAVLNGADYSFVQVDTATCPSTSLQCGMQKDAAGDTVFVSSALPTPGECVNVAAQIPQDGEFKICGPGKFSLSRMSCDKHDYKAITIEQATNAFSASDCKIYKISDYYQIHGYIGSATYTCDATAR